MKLHPALLCLFAISQLGIVSRPAAAAIAGDVVYGPVNVEAHGSGPGVIGWFDGPPPTTATHPWTVSAWVRPTAPVAKPTLVAGFGDGIDYVGSQRYFAADANGWYFWVGSQDKGAGGRFTNDPISRDIVPQAGAAPVTADHWQFLAATYDGKTLSFYVDGKPVASKEIKLNESAMQPLIAPPPAWKDGSAFAGRIAHFTISANTVGAGEIAALAQAPVAALDALRFDPTPGGPTPDNRWTEFRGSRNLPPQNPDTFPKPVPPVSTARVPKLAPHPLPVLAPDGRLVLDRGWELADAGTVSALPAEIGRPTFDAHAWMDAIVPGTVLTTLVQQGIYPDPLHGLNNLLIPDLAKKTWWYRVAFDTPPQWKGRAVHLTFNGTNYHAQVWLNGKPLGEINGAFIRGEFEATPALAASGPNVLAVRIWPQPHFWMGHEESVKAGAGGNGADGSFDGPTFFCSEGWDWIPTIRDRNTGIWQDVVLRATGPATVGDPRVVTTLPQLPDVSLANVTVQAEVRNLTAAQQRVTLEGALGDVRFSVPVTLAPGETKTVTADPKMIPALAIKNPRLWWPNGYGEPTLQDLTLRVLDSGNQESDRLTQRVGLRQMDYDYLPKGPKTEGKTPLVVKVNGRRIFILGGDWGMDDAMKRSSVEHLEPYFRLHRDAHATMIRNWMGQQTEESFYALADKYGILVWNDFWLSTSGWSAPPADAERWLANSADAIKRFRNHACIAVWCGRNEGAMPGWLEAPFKKQLAELDGTRTFESSSTFGDHLMGSGPWTYKDPVWYFKDHAHGFTTELGINSVPTADAIKAMLDPSQYWPTNDAWAYHDYHSAAHGPVKEYVGAMEKSYGQAAGLEDFVRRIQMLNYTHHRAMLEAWNSKMWNPTTGLLLWMTHPAQPSMVWQIYSSDYDTHAAFYGFQHAAEPLHVQWNLDTDKAAVVNHLGVPFKNSTVTVRIIGLDGREVSKNAVNVDAAPDATAEVADLHWPDPASAPVTFLELEWRDSGGRLLSENFYWHSAKPEELQALNTLPQVKLGGSVQFTRAGGEITGKITLTNPSVSVALMTHLVVRDAVSGKRILPAYYSDNYVSLLPGDKRDLTVTCPMKDAAGAMKVTLEGWNVTPSSL